jgi:hypothetical protein
LPITAADIRPEKAPEINEPEYRMAVRRPSSWGVYHPLRRYNPPGW